MTFTPSNDVRRAEHIPEDDPAALHLRTRFDGPIFGIRGPHGRLVSWAALKLKSDHVWELAVATEADYRGRGYARDVYFSCNMRIDALRRAAKRELAQGGEIGRREEMLERANDAGITIAGYPPL